MDGLMALQIPRSASLRCLMLGWVGPLWSLTRAQVFYSFASEARSYGIVSAWGLEYSGETRNLLPIRVAPKNWKTLPSHTDYICNTYLVLVLRRGSSSEERE